VLQPVERREKEGQKAEILSFVSSPTPEPMMGWVSTPCVSFFTSIGRRDIRKTGLSRERRDKRGRASKVREPLLLLDSLLNEDDRDEAPSISPLAHSSSILWSTC